jgi:choice-of-anchor A domain-containing protein
MKTSLIICSLLTLITFKAQANVEKCQVKSVFNLVVFASEDLVAKNLLSEGSLASGRSINLFNSNIMNSDCRALTTPGQISLLESKVIGSIEGLTKVRIQSTTVNGSVRSSNKMDLKDSRVGLMITPMGANMVNSEREKWWKSSVISSMDVTKFKNELMKESMALKNLTSSMVKQITYKDALTISLRDEKNILHFTSEQMAGIKRLEIRGDKKQKLILNISGQKASLNDLLIDISGDINPSNIVWKFHEATTLDIANTVDQILGIPGRVLAPFAKVVIDQALITGGVFAKSIAVNVNEERGTSEIKKE